MGSRVKDQTTPHQPLLSSLVVRPTDSGGGGGIGGAGSDYEPGEVRRDPPRNTRSDDHGYRMRAGSVSPVHHRDTHHSYSPGFEHSGGAPRNRGFGNGRDHGRDLGRYRESSPSYGRGKDGGRFAGRGYDRSGHGPGPFRVEGLPRNNPNVQPREGDWICSDPSCKNLNFARREHCNNCNRPRYAPVGSPRRSYPGPAFTPRQRFPGPLSNHSPGRILNGGYRSPPRAWPRHAPRAARPPPRHEGRFHDPPLRSSKQDYPEDDYRERSRYDRPMPPDWGRRDRGRESFFNEKRGYGRRAVSPPSAPPPRGWGHHIRDRSRSPVRGGAPPKDFESDVYMNRGRNNRCDVGQDGF